MKILFIIKLKGNVLYINSNYELKQTKNNLLIIDIY